MFFVFVLKIYQKIFQGFVIFLFHLILKNNNELSAESLVLFKKRYKQKNHFINRADLAKNSISLKNKSISKTK